MINRAFSSPDHCKTSVCSWSTDAFLRSLTRRWQITDVISNSAFPNQKADLWMRLLEDECFPFFYYLLQEVFFLLAMSIKVLALWSRVQIASQINWVSLISLVSL